MKCKAAPRKADLINYKLGHSMGCCDFKNY